MRGVNEERHSRVGGNLLIIIRLPNFVISRIGGQISPSPRNAKSETHKTRKSIGLVILIMPHFRKPHQIY